MPVVTFDYKDFLKLFGYDIAMDELASKLPMIGADLDKIENENISIEFFPNRPDLASVEGIARASRAFFGFEKGLKKYDIIKSDVTITVDPSVKNVRPYVTTSLIKNVTMTDELISSLMDMQEKLHFGLGRNRKKVAIGVHNFEPIEPPIKYKAVNPESVQFVPLAKVESMTLGEILKRHEKGMDYANLLDGYSKYPLIVDSNNNVLSFPPIINGSLTEVTPFTTELFIDVTGSDLSAISVALNIVTTALAERGGKIFSTHVIYDDKSFLYPDLNPNKRRLSVAYCNKILGTNFDQSVISDCLQKMGYNATFIDPFIEVEIPAWRSDVLHDIDLVEDVAVGYGYENFEIDFPKVPTYGKSMYGSNYYKVIRSVLIGLGFNEVTTFTISNEKDEFEKMGLEIAERVIIENPIGEEYSCLRVGLIPSLLKILTENRHHPLPQQIFELGIVIDDKFKNKLNLSALKISAKANFTECKSIVESLMRELDIKYALTESKHSAFITGRCAFIVSNDKQIGYFGELHPRTITEFNLEHPIIAFEIFVDNLL